jgi:hypothetical protein
VLVGFDVERLAVRVRGVAEMWAGRSRSFARLKRSATLATSSAVYLAIEGLDSVYSPEYKSNKSILQPTSRPGANHPQRFQETAFDPASGAALARLEQKVVATIARAIARTAYNRS